MMPLFEKKGVACVHRRSGEEVIIASTQWIKGEVYYNCLVPQLNEKGKIELCHVTYRETEVEFG